MELCFFLDDEVASLTKKGQIDLFSSTTPSFYLWNLPDPNVQLQWLRAAFCLAMTVAAGFSENGQIDPFPSTTRSVSVNNPPFFRQQLSVSTSGSNRTLG